MATKRELYELLLDISDYIDKLNKLSNSKCYSLEYNSEKLYIKHLRNFLMTTW